MVKSGHDDEILFVGGSGNISTACSRLAAERGIELVHFTGACAGRLAASVRTIHGDLHDRRPWRKALASEAFDVVVNWIVFDPAEAAADVEMSPARSGSTCSFSTATVYPERAALHRPRGNAARPTLFGVRAKEDCHEQFFMEAHPTARIPFTSCGPRSPTADTWVPTAFGSISLLHRLRRGLPLVVHGDGTSLWVMTTPALLPRVCSPLWQARKPWRGIFTSPPTRS